MVSELPLLLGLVLAVIPGQDSVLSGGPAVWGQAPSSELDVLSSSENGLVLGSGSGVDVLSESGVSSDSSG